MAKSKSFRPGCGPRSRSVRRHRPRRAAFVAALAFLVGAAAAAWPAAAAPSARTVAAPEAALPLRLSVGANGALTIGGLPPFTYDGRRGIGTGTLTPVVGAPGAYDVMIPAASLHVPPLPMIAALPDVPLRVDITPRTMAGRVDVCTGSVSLAFDAVFTPVVGDTRFTPLSVVTPLSSDSMTVDGVTVTGRRLDPFGSARIAGVAHVPRTGDLWVDALLQLPTPAGATLDVDFDVAGGLPRCPSAPATGATARMTLRQGGRLTIAKFPAFAYDGAGSGGIARLSPIPGAACRFAFHADAGSLEIPPLLLFPPFDLARVEIQPKAIDGTIDLATGRTDLAFDAVFQPVAFDYRPTPISVITTLTSEASAGTFQSRAGSRIDAWGDARLVGVAKVPRTGDFFVDWLLSLPTDAVADLAVHFDVAGTACAPPVNPVP